MAAPKKNKKDKPKAVAFLNWELELKNGKTLKSNRGFPIFQNPDYPDAKEDLLIALAKQSENGVVEVTMKVRIALNTAGDSDEVTADDIVLAV